MNHFIQFWFLLGVLVGCATHGRDVLNSNRPLLDKYKDFLFFGFAIAWAFPIMLIGWLSSKAPR
jgi:hypothetical protein